MKKIVSLLCFLVFINSFSQTNQLWKGYFSYNGIKDVSVSSNKIFAASENALFSKDLDTNDLKTTNTIDGLSSQVISCMYYSPTFKKTIVGYENGLINIVDETTGVITKKVDIINKNIAPNIKKVNHFYEYEGKIYVSGDFGIVVFSLDTLLFGDTYFIGTSPNTDIIVNQVTVYKGFIYAATNDFGLKRADVSNPYLIDSSQWSTVVSGNFSGVASLGNNLVATQLYSSAIKSADGLNFTNLNPTINNSVDVRATNDKLLITTSNTIYVFNNILGLSKQLSASQIPDISATFSCATSINDVLYIGTTENGLISTSLNNTSSFTFMSPSGPLRNDIFSINASSSNLWAVYGGYAREGLQPQFKGRGFSKLPKNQDWKHFKAVDANYAVDLVRITVNPKNENQVFISSYYNGLLKFENDKLVTQYVRTNSSLETIYPTDPVNENIRIEQSVYDKQGNLWMTVALVNKAINVMLANGTWKSYNTSAINLTYGPWFFGMDVDKNNTKWIASRGNGVVGFNENYDNKLTSIEVGEGESQLPESVQVVAVDKKNQLWIGTRSGLRILTSVDSFLSDEPLTVKNIVILENGLAQELMNKQYIMDIVVDGANNKWIATLKSGVFMVSGDGQTTYHHFTTSNSPLPSDEVNDIDINPTTGEVFLVTSRGMVSYKGTAVGPADNLDNVIVFPNPVRPEFEGTVTITGLTDKANVKITDIEGSLVHEAISEGGSIQWDTKAFGKYKVASGVYMVFVAGANGEETTVRKLMIVR